MHLKDTNNKLVIIMVGLPGRGKSFLTSKLSRYLNWLDYKCAKFNLGDYRRKLFKLESEDPSFYDSENEQGMLMRRQCTEACLNDLADSLVNGANAAIFDGTNHTNARRAFAESHLRSRLSNHIVLKIMYLETVFTEAGSAPDPDFETSLLSSDDYKDMERSAALAHYRRRVALYEATYESLDEERDLSFIKIFNIGERIVSNNIRGYLPGRLVFFLHNVRLNNKAVWFSRHGESEFNVRGLIGGDAPLSAAGHRYSIALGEYILAQPELQHSQFSVWTSNLLRTIQTAGHIPERDSGGVDKNNNNAVRYTGTIAKVSWRQLEEIQVGVCDAMTYEEIERKFPEEFQARKRDKLRYRYPQGESYLDVMTRLEPVIFELERRKGPVLVIGHRAVLRCLLSYFLDLDATSIPHLDVPLHTVMKLEGGTHGQPPYLSRLLLTEASSADHG
jgi:broad specificity phosphatase PhoE